MSQQKSASATPSASSRQSPGILRIAGITALAGVICGVGALIGAAIGSNDGIPNSKALFAVLGMLAVSIATAFLLPKTWRRQWAASLPFFWFFLGGSLIAEYYFGVDNSVATPIRANLGDTRRSSCGQSHLEVSVQGKRRMTPPFNFADQSL